MEVTGHSILDRIGLRYVNLIDVPGRGSYDILDYIAAGPSVADVLKRPIASFYQRSELIYEEPRGVLIHQFGLAQHDKREALLVDIDFNSGQAPIKMSDRKSIEHWVEMAHDTIYSAFVVSLNPKFLAQLK